MSQSKKGYVQLLSYAPSAEQLPVYVHYCISSFYSPYTSTYSKGFHADHGTVQKCTVLYCTLFFDLYQSNTYQDSGWLKTEERFHYMYSTYSRIKGTYIQFIIYDTLR